MEKNLAITLHHMTSLNLAFSAFSKHIIVFCGFEWYARNVNDKLICIAGGRQRIIQIHHQQNIRRSGEKNALHKSHRAYRANQRKLQGRRKCVCFSDLWQRTLSGRLRDGNSKSCAIIISRPSRKEMLMVHIVDQ